MKTVLILHGIQGYPGIHWQQWLYGELVKQGYQVLMPKFPNANHPNRKSWLKTIKKTVKQINLKNLIIVAHSLGVTSALDLLETLDTPIKALVSVSGFSKDYGLELNSYFLKEKSINFKKIRQNCKNFFVYYGDNDPYVPQKVLKDLADSLGVKPRIFPHGGHLNTEAGYTRFPELLKIIFH
ncbi:MAG TPA: alpha/beta hydrolase [Candidatus Bathyarchaeia archaeon]|nr:alpha/beta hydrolase [Candidatus Bathyarchaeia archaeon]